MNEYKPQWLVTRGVEIFARNCLVEINFITLDKKKMKLFAQLDLDSLIHFSRSV